MIELPPHIILAPLRAELKRLRDAGVIAHPPVSPPLTLVVQTVKAYSEE